MASTSKKGEVTFFDRIAVGLFFALLAVITLFIIPLMFFLAGGLAPWHEIYLYGAIIFTAIMFLLGFFLKITILVNFYGRIWDVFYRLFIGESPKQ
jgi:hypothetical protein